MPDTLEYHEQIMKLRADVAAQRATIARQRAELIGLEKRRQQNITNCDAALEAIERLEEQIAGLIEVHGDPEEI